jgi:Flp pilus assembly protein TadD
MKHSLLLVAVSTSALLAGCARNADQAFQDVAPAAAQDAAAPSAVAPLTTLSQEALARGDAAAAIPLAERALESAPGDVDAGLALAQAHLMQGDPVKAEGLFRDVLKHDADSAAANTGLGLSLLAQQREEEARTVLMAAAKQKANVQTKSNIAFALTLAGAPKEAVELLEPVAMGKESSPKVRQNFAFALVMADNRARAFEVAGYDLDGVAAARQVSAWSDVARAPFKQRLTQMAGLTVVDAPAYAKVEAPKPVETVKPVEVAAADMPAEKVELVVVPEEKKPVAVENAAPVEAPVEMAAVEPEKPVVAEKVSVKPVVLRPATPSPVEAASFSPVLPTPSVKKAVETVATVSKFANWVVQVGAITFKTDQTKSLTKIFENRLGNKASVRVVTVDAPNGKLHRVVLAEPKTRQEAQSTCATLRAKGRACFARTVAGISQPVVAAASVTPAKPVVLKAAAPKSVPFQKASVVKAKVAAKPTVTKAAAKPAVAKPVAKPAATKETAKETAKVIKI